MKVLLPSILAVLLTPVVFLGLSCIEPLAGWVGSDAVWIALTPVFQFIGVAGSEGEENFLLCALLIMSFVVAATLVWIGSTFIRGWRERQA